MSALVRHISTTAVSCLLGIFLFAQETGAPDSKQPAGQVSDSLKVKEGSDAGPRKKDSIANRVTIISAKDSLADDEPVKMTKADTLQDRIRKHVTPFRAGFLSAMVPGLGQIYNKKYWKVPIVYGLLFITINQLLSYNNEYEGYRKAYARRRAGYMDDEYYDRDGSGVVPGSPDVPDDSILGLLRSTKESRDLLAVAVVAVYALNIIDASVDAHLKYYNMDLKLTFSPYARPPIRNHWDSGHYGLALTINIKNRR